MKASVHRTPPAREPLRSLQLVSLPEVTRVLGFKCPKTVLSLVERDPAFPRPGYLGRRAMFRAEDVRQFLQRNTAAAASA